MGKGRHKRSSKAKRRKTSNKPKLLAVIGVAVFVLGLIGFGAGQLHRTQAAPQAVANLSGSGSEVTSLDAAPTDGTAANAHNASASDPLTQYLGPETNPNGLLQAESGAVGQPTLVWFHADWCHVCQQIKPEVAELGQAYDGRVHFVRLNVDDPAARQALSQYRMRATPTFVLFDADGQILGNVPGWPGYDQLAAAFDQLLAGG